MAGYAIALGCIVVGVLLSAGAIMQVLRGETWGGGTGGRPGPLRRSEQPRRFWYVFWMRVVLGPLATLAGTAGLVHLLAQ